MANEERKVVDSACLVLAFELIVGLIADFTLEDFLVGSIPIRADNFEDFLKGLIP